MGKEAHLYDQTIAAELHNNFKDRDHWLASREIPSINKFELSVLLIYSRDCASA
jgi:hypothetical protein